ncbi:outer membrane beta-barrel protein [Pseudoduganella sp.]|uniref:outer membrane beta-barrel protein n=1 Tax=Pseudoduganella sp. TaxID=1880898 RepID=UPI0035B19025
MKHLIAIAAFAAAGAAQAQDYFAGASIIAPGNTNLDTAAGRIESKNDPLRFKLYGGINFTDSLALEAGYAHFGKDRFAAPGANIGISSDTLFVAARGTWRLNDSFELFGRAGVSAQRYRIDNLADAPRSKNGFSPLLGVGLGYKLNDKVTLTLEAEHFGRIDINKNGKRFGRGAYSAGLKYAF